MARVWCQDPVTLAQCYHRAESLGSPLQMEKHELSGGRQPTKDSPLYLLLLAAQLMEILVFFAICPEQWLGIIASQ